MFRDYKKIYVWSVGHELCIDLYKLCELLPKEEHNMINQIKRACVSIPINIAEGTSRKTRKSFLQFLEYSYGSGKEIEALMLICKDLKFINEINFEFYNKKIDYFLRSMFKFIKSVNEKVFYKNFNLNQF